MELSLQEIEAVINFWRARCPVRDNAVLLSPEVNQLAAVYALMIFRRQSSLPVEQLDARLRTIVQTWRDSS